MVLGIHNCVEDAVAYVEQLDDLDRAVRGAKLGEAFDGAEHQCHVLISKTGNIPLVPKVVGDRYRNHRVH